MKKIILIPIVFLFSLSGQNALAHQPRIVSGEKTIRIENPEVSQAFYGELNGRPAYFEINSDTSFKFYAGVLVPALPGIRKDVSAKIYPESKENVKELFFLNGSDYSWTYFYEKFAGDSYYKGPEATGNLEKGKYLIDVFNPGNTGKYVLVIGEKEEFPMVEILNTLRILPKIKNNFFGKSSFSAFFNRIGFFILLPFLVVIGTIVLFTLLFLRFKRRRSKSK